MSNADRRRRAAVTVALGLALLAPAGNGSGARAQDAKPDMVTSYLAVLTEYVTGDPVQAVASLRRWAPSNTIPVQRSAVWDAKTLRAAAMLETDAAFDARTTLEAMTSRLENAGQWLVQAETIAPDADTSKIRRRWHLAVGRQLIWNGFMGIADRILTAACRLYPGDIDLLFASGTAKESLAQSFVVDPSMPGWQVTAVRKRRTDTLADARALFERVVKSSPAAQEAKVRLARLLILQGDDRRAAVLLEGARAGAPPLRPEVRYLASLLLGELRTRDGQLPQAIELFREARGLIPGAQSAYLAHARALQVAGQIDAAASVVQEMLARPFQKTDPWRQYPLGFDEAAMNLAPLRDEVRRQ
jgi:tetratricopeptide (TPR) repeat protein